MLCETVKETSWALSLSDGASWCVAAQMCPVVLEAMSPWVPYGCNPQACSFHLCSLAYSSLLLGGDAGQLEPFPCAPPCPLTLPLQESFCDE